MKVYISGKTREQAGADFEYYEQMIRDRGHEPVNPMKNGLPFDAPWEEHMELDLRLLKGCHAIYMMSDWVTSCGAQIELQKAFSAEILILNDTNLTECLCKDVQKTKQEKNRSDMLQSIEDKINEKTATNANKTIDIQNPKTI